MKLGYDQEVLLLPEARNASEVKKKKAEKKRKKIANQTKENNYYENNITAFACHIETSYVIDVSVNEVRSRLIICTNYFT